MGTMDGHMLGSQLNWGRDSPTSSSLRSYGFLSDAQAKSGGERELVCISHLNQSIATFFGGRGGVGPGICRWVHPTHLEGGQLCPRGTNLYFRGSKVDQRRTSSWYFRLAAQGRAKDVFVVLQADGRTPQQQKRVAQTGLGADRSAGFPS